MKSILALDLSKSSTGFAYGFPSETPRSGSVQFGTPQHSEAEVGAKALVWLSKTMPEIIGYVPDIIAIEAAWEGNGGHSAHTSAVLLGLQFMMQGVAFLKTRTQPRMVKVDRARKIFTGVGRYASGEAKPAVQRRCIELGWLDNETLQADRADALCVWAAIASEQMPSLAFAPPPKPKARREPAQEPRF
jgi:hypothetical protein